MNEVTIEQLLQAVAPRIESQSTSLANGRHQLTPFDDHLYRVGTIPAAPPLRPAVAPEPRESFAPSALQERVSTAQSRSANPHEAPVSARQPEQQPRPAGQAAEAGDPSGVVTSKDSANLPDSNAAETDGNAARVEAATEALSFSATIHGEQLADRGEAGFVARQAQALQNQEQQIAAPTDAADVPAAEETAADAVPGGRPLRGAADGEQSGEGESPTRAAPLQESGEQGNARLAANPQVATAEGAGEHGWQSSQPKGDAPTGAQSIQEDLRPTSGNPAEEAAVDSDATSSRPAHRPATKPDVDPNSRADTALGGAAGQATSAEPAAANPKSDRRHSESRSRGAVTARDSSRSISASQGDQQPAAPGATVLAPAAIEVAAVAAPEKSAGGEAKTPPKSEGLLMTWGRIQRGGDKQTEARTQEQDAFQKVDPARFVNRVAKAFYTAHQRGGSLQLRLSPPELGSLRLELTVRDGVMAAALETESIAARRVLLEHLPMLRERLAEQNIRIERFDVDVRRDGGGQSGPGTQHQDSNARLQAQVPPDEKRVPAAAEAAVSAAAVPLVSNAGLNVVA